MRNKFQLSRLNRVRLWGVITHQSLCWEIDGWSRSYSKRRTVNGQMICLAGLGRTTQHSSRRRIFWCHRCNAWQVGQRRRKGLCCYLLLLTFELFPSFVVNLKETVVNQVQSVMTCSYIASCLTKLPRSSLCCLRWSWSFESLAVNNLILLTKNYLQLLFSYCWSWRNWMWIFIKQIAIQLEFIVICCVICAYTGCNKENGLLKFFAIFSATVWDFNVKFYSFI